VGGGSVVRALGTTFNLNNSAGTCAQISNTGTGTSVNFPVLLGAPAGSGPTIDFNGSDANVVGLFTSKGASSAIGFAPNYAIQLRVPATASAVNFVQVTGSTTTNFTSISAQGSDTNVVMALVSKGTSPLIFATGTSSGNGQLRVTHTASAVNRMQITGSTAGNAPAMSVDGTDTNISMAFQPKGTGAINLAAGSSGVNVSNGGTVTAINRTASGANYTSIPSCVISAPTTAGGVQATVSLVMAAQSGTAVTPANGGTGYTLNDVLTVVGGTFAQVAQFTVTGVSAGVVTQVTRNNTTNFGNYTVLPTSPAATTGGTGTGCTLNMRWEVVTFTITNAGSGYIEQPTVTFSGGGGSGASAYASVGSVPTVRTLTTEMQFTTAGGVGFEVQTFGAGTTTSRLATFASSSGNPTILEPRGASTNIDTVYSSRGTGVIRFITNSFSLGTGAEQLRVSHTASAVNYVQVTGSATGGVPLILAQGSDTNVNIATASKGTGYLAFRTNTSTEQFRVFNTTSAVNRIEITGSIASAAPLIKSEGTDTNIDLALTPKGTGVVQFGTRTASSDVPITGYIEIKDAGGTIRRLAVVG
jgi:hypothetical protein